MEDWWRSWTGDCGTVNRFLDWGTCTQVYTPTHLHTHLHRPTSLYVHSTIRACIYGIRNWPHQPLKLKIVYYIVDHALKGQTLHIVDGLKVRLFVFLIGESQRNYLNCG